jgi:DNA-binding transcriptional regulator YdaS (Cro superfamily)
MDEITKAAVIAAGGPIKLAKALGIRRQAVEQWRRVPSERCLAVEELSGISRHVLRPDIYGPLDRKGQGSGKAA